jgi:hypothetical protein
MASTETVRVPVEANHSKETVTASTVFVEIMTVSTGTLTIYGTQAVSMGMTVYASPDSLGVSMGMTVSKETITETARVHKLITLITLE